MNSVARKWSFTMGLVAILGLAGPRPTRAQVDPPRTVVVLLFDGFAASLLDKLPAPSLERLRREGAWSHRMVPAFPTVSLINQTTISTGCWPARHGIISNIFVDPQRGVYDHDHDADWMLGCEHLHQAAERQGVRSAALGWVGRYSSTHGDRATHITHEKVWADYPSDEERANQVIRLLQLPDGERPRLITAYFHGPDGAEHFHGMDSHEAREAVVDSDRQIGRILAAIEASPQRQSTALLITTDHGMLEVSTNVNVKKILLNHGIQARFRSSGTTSFLYFDDRSQIDAAFTVLSRYEQFDVLRKEALPEYAHLGDSARVGDLILSARPPYFIEDIDNWPWWAKWLGSWGPEFLWARYALKATHGYPPDTSGIEGILYAWGNGVAAGRELGPVRAIDIHPTATQLLGISPGQPVDGQVIQELLVTGQP